MINLLLCSVLLSASIAGARASDAPPLAVSVSLPPQVWLVESIGGPRVAVEALVGSGDSEETYAPTDAQVSTTLRSAIFLRVGASFEEAPWFRALAASRLHIVDARSGVEMLPMTDGASHGHGPRSSTETDPHIWTSPRRLAVQARTVAAALAARDPEGRDFYQGRLRDTTRALELLDRELAEALALHRGRAFFVFHPTWGYFANDYGLRQIAIEVDGKPPSDRDLTRLLERARVERPRALLVEPTAPQAGAAAVANAIGARVVRIDSLAPDVPDNLRRLARSLVESFAP